MEFFFYILNYFKVGHFRCFLCILGQIKNQSLYSIHELWITEVFSKSANIIKRDNLKPALSHQLLKLGSEFRLIIVKDNFPFAHFEFLLVIINAGPSFLFSAVISQLLRLRMFFVKAKPN